MNLTQIINAKSDVLTDAEKITAIAEIVTKARAAYGNGKVVIPEPIIHGTADGSVAIKYLSDADKVAIAGQEIRVIRARAIEAVEATTGAVLKVEVERLLAVNSTLVNITAQSESEYI